MWEAAREPGVHGHDIEVTEAHRRLNPAAPTRVWSIPPTSYKAGIDGKLVSTYETLYDAAAYSAP